MNSGIVRERKNFRKFFKLFLVGGGLKITVTGCGKFPILITYSIIQEKVNIN